jgi:hypothetical protein
VRFGDYQSYGNLGCSAIKCGRWVPVRINVLLDCVHRDIQVLWNLGPRTQSKSTFMLIIILHRQNPIEFIMGTSVLFAEDCNLESLLTLIPD